MNPFQRIRSSVPCGGVMIRLPSRIPQEHLSAARLQCCRLLSAKSTAPGVGPPFFPTRGPQPSRISRFVNPMEGEPEPAFRPISANSVSLISPAAPRRSPDTARQARPGATVDPPRKRSKIGAVRRAVIPAAKAPQQAVGRSCPRSRGRGSRCRRYAESTSASP